VNLRFSTPIANQNLPALVTLANPLESQIEKRDSSTANMNVREHGKLGRFGMTLIEILVVVVLVLILAAMLLPATSPRHITTKVGRAKMDMKNLASAINQYEATYSRWPVAESDRNSDVTYGISPADVQGFQKIDGTKMVATNSDMMIVLMDIDRGINTGHKLNPQQHRFFDPKMVDDTKSHGLSTVDFQFRDPWGNPYVISLDINHDGHMRDACYANPKVSAQGMTGLVAHGSGPYELYGPVMIWSRGPDGKVSAATRANTGVNKDNVTGWQ
jgi:prepilin-type N-terminal cleavage/methylation domain-containing protein